MELLWYYYGIIIVILWYYYGIMVLYSIIVLWYCYGIIIVLVLGFHLSRIIITYLQYMRVFLKTTCFSVLL